MSRSKELTPTQRSAVVLEANGYETAKVAKALEVAPNTIRKWHEKPEYMAALEKASEDTAEELGPLIEQVRRNLAVAVLKSIETITEAQDAETLRGQPNWNARLAAAIAALQHMKIVDPPKVGQGNGEGSREGGPQTAVIVVGAEQAAKIIQQPTAGEIPEEVEGTAEDA